MRVAVVGHVEWIDFVRVAAMPRAGDIVHASDAWEEPGGGGAVAAVQFARLGHDTTFFTALGDDERGRRAYAGLAAMGVRIEAVTRPTSTRRAITHVDDAGERTITVLGARLAPDASDPLPWDLLAGMDGVYLTACDPDTVRRARAARTLVATPRMLPALRDSGVFLDALVGSATDPAERVPAGALDPSPGVRVATDGARGGTARTADGHLLTYAPAAAPPVVDTYGCGDCFAAGLTAALTRGRPIEEALGFAASCGAAVLGGRGPYTTQQGA